MSRTFVEKFQVDSYKRAFENLGKTVNGELRELRMQEQHNQRLLLEERNQKQFKRDMQLRNRDILEMQMVEKQQLVKTQRVEDMKSWIEPEYYGYPNRPHHYEDPMNLKHKAMQKHVKQSLEEQMREKNMIKRLKNMEEEVVDKYCLNMAHRSLINDNIKRREKLSNDREHLKRVWNLTEKTNVLNKAIDQFQRGKYSNPEVLQKTCDQLNFYELKNSNRYSSVSPDTQRHDLDLSFMKHNEPKSMRHSVDLKKEVSKFNPDFSNKREVKSRFEMLTKKEEYIQNEKLKLMKTISEHPKWINTSPIKPKTLTPLKSF